MDRLITRIQPSELAFTAVHDLVDLGPHPEDGEPVVGEAWYVQAISPAGHKWRRFIGLYDPRLAFHYRPRGTPADRDALEDRTHTIAARLEDLRGMRRLTLDACQWEYIGAAYGSPAYSAEDEYRLMDESERDYYGRGF